jgi:hypothetical protein
LETRWDCIWIGFGPSWQLSEVQVVIVPPVLIEDRLLLWMVVRLHTYYPEHTLAYGGGKTCYSLVMGFSTFRTDCYGWIIGWRSKHHTEAGPQVLEAWSPSLDGDLDPLTLVERVGLVCSQGINEACVSGYPARIH